MKISFKLVLAAWLLTISLVSNSEAGSFGNLRGKSTSNNSVKALSNKNFSSKNFSSNKTGNFSNSNLSRNLTRKSPVLNNSSSRFKTTNSVNKSNSFKNLAPVKKMSPVQNMKPAIGGKLNVGNSQFKNLKPGLTKRTQSPVLGGNAKIPGVVLQPRNPVTGGKNLPIKPFPGGKVTPINPFPGGKIPPINPNPGGVKPPINPFPGGGKPPINPFPGGGKPPINPFPGGKIPPINPNPGGVKPPINPFPGGGKPPINPFPGGGKPPINPFPGGGKPPINPNPGGGLPPIDPGTGGGTPPINPQPPYCPPHCPPHYCPPGWWPRPICLPSFNLCRPVCYNTCVTTVCPTVVVDQTVIVEEQVEQVAAEPMLQLLVGRPATLEAEGLGEVPGAVAIEVGGIGLPTQVRSWTDRMLVIDVPFVGLNGPTPAMMHLFDANGKPLASIPVELVVPVEEMPAQAAE